MKKLASEIQPGDVVTWVGAFKDYQVVEAPIPDDQIPYKVRFTVRHARDGTKPCRLDADREVEVRSVAPDLPFSASDEHPIPWSIENYGVGTLMVSDGNGHVVAVVKCTTEEQYRGIQKRVNRVNDHDRRQAEFQRYIDQRGGAAQVEPLDLWLAAARAEAEEKDARIDHLEVCVQSLQGEIDDLQDLLDGIYEHARAIVDTADQDFDPDHE